MAVNYVVHIFYINVFVLFTTARLDPRGLAPFEAKMIFFSVTGPPFQKSDPVMYEYVLASVPPFPKSGSSSGLHVEVMLPSNIPNFCRRCRSYLSYFYFKHNILGEMGLL